MKGVAVIGVAFLVLVSMVDCQKEVKCYVCMGRDSENCVYGEAACTGYCYKVVDTRNDLIAKGCTPQTGLPTTTEVSDWAPTPHITLYWTPKNEKGEREYIIGQTRFCESSYCNSGSKFSSNTVLGLSFALISMLMTGFVLRL